MFPPVFLWGLAFVALSPLMWLAWVMGGSDEDEPGAQATGLATSGVQTRRSRSGPVEAGASRRRMMRAALQGVFIAVIPMWAFHHLWIWKVTNAGFPVLILYLSVYAPLFVWIGARWRRWVMGVGRKHEGEHGPAAQVRGTGGGGVGAEPWHGPSEKVRGDQSQSHDQQRERSHDQEHGPAAQVRGTGSGRRGEWKFWLGLPVIWVGLEMLRGAIVWDGYPWFFVGHPTIQNSSCALIARLTGATGTSLLVADLNAIAVSSVAAWWGLTPAQRRGRGAKIFAAMHLILIAGLVVTSIVPKPQWGASATDSTVAVIQTNVPQDNRVAWSFPQRRADFETFKRLTREVAREKPDLIVWPETMFPGIALNDDAVRVEKGAGLLFNDPVAGGTPSTVFYDELLALQKELGVPMVVGAIAKEGLRIDTVEWPGGGTRIEMDAAATFNSAFVVSEGAVQPERYDKVKLTPFGEYMPYISWSDWLEKNLLALGAGGMSFDLDAGRVYRALEAPARDDSEPPHPADAASANLSHEGRGEINTERNHAAGRSLRIATPICFEATMPAVCRRLVYGGGWRAERKADVLVNLTNDGWFGGSRATHENHLLLARWRCIELGTPMVRAANTGISCSIDAAGRVTDRLGIGKEGVLIARVSLPRSAWHGPAQQVRGEQPAAQDPEHGPASQVRGTGVGTGIGTGAGAGGGFGAPTPYARIGDSVGWACLAGMGVMAGLTFAARGGAGRRKMGQTERGGPGGRKETNDGVA